MGIHQIQITYDEVQDRILLRLSTTDDCEFRFWLTRRFVKRMWDLLVKMLEQDEAVIQQTDAESRRAVLGLQHEGFLQQADFSRRFEERPFRRPLGEEPVLLAKGVGKRIQDGSYALSLHPQQGAGIDLTLDVRLLHLFSKLLYDAVGRADWDIRLAVSQDSAKRQELRH